MRLKEDIVIESNVWLLMRERGKLVPGSHREGHNVFTTNGKNWLAKLIAWSTISGTDIAYTNRRVRWMALGKGSQLEASTVSQLADPVLATPTDYLRPIQTVEFPTSTSTRFIKEFGTTDDPGIGFFILPDGSFLDGSARTGQMRCDDHRILAGLYPNANKAEQKHGSRYALLVKVMQRANLIRWLPESWSADVVTQPTGYQISTLVDLAQVQTLTVEVFRQTREFEAHDAERIEGWIDRKL
jgi:hypothetical protein